MTMLDKRRVLGVTLIELMVVIAILALLALIGYPQYNQLLLKGRRADARMGIMQIVGAQERERRLYGGFSEPSIPLPGVIANDGAPVPDANSDFNNVMRQVNREHAAEYIFTVAATNTAYTITATPIGGQADDTECFSFSIDQLGRSAAENDGGGDATDLCWK